ncbi:MAG: tetratricopeptide repeat protein [bacterium]|nr:tetratricopeptide repeat protein [bacterium]
MIAIVLVIIFAVITYLTITKPKFLRGFPAVSALDDSVNTNDTHLEKLLDKANRYYLQREFLAAEKAYLKLLKIDHKNTWSYNRLGFIYAHMSNFPDAIECFKIVVDAKPNPASYQNLGMVYLKNRDFTKAATVLEKSTELKPEPQRLVSLARVYRILSKYSLQVATLQKALDMDKQNTQIMQLLAEAYLDNKDKENADKIFKKILKIDPQNVRAHQELTKK